MRTSAHALNSAFKFSVFDAHLSHRDDGGSKDDASTDGPGTDGPGTGGNGGAAPHRYGLRSTTAALRRQSL